MLSFHYPFRRRHTQCRVFAPLQCSPRLTHNAGSSLLFHAPFCFAIYTKASRRSTITPRCYVLRAHNIEFHFFFVIVLLKCSSHGMHLALHRCVIFLQNVYYTDHDYKNIERLWWFITSLVLIASEIFHDFRSEICTIFHDFRSEILLKQFIPNEF